MKSAYFFYLIFSGLLIINPVFKVRHAYLSSSSADRATTLSPKQNAQTNLSVTTINARSFGLLPSATAAQNTLALQKISARINTSKGGVLLVINKGIYSVGKERPARTGDKRSRYLGETMLTIDSCTKPVIIEGNGATLKLSNGLHFGSFQNETGAAYNAPRGGFYNYDYAAYPQSLVVLQQNESVVIHNLVLDVNVQNLNVGGYWGDTGIQLPGDGIFCSDNNSVTFDGVTSRYFPRDGIMVGNHIADVKTPVRKVSLLNCVFDGNARQGFSWIGGNHLYAYSCKFINSGKTINNKAKQPVLSAPGAGIDMEAEMGLIRNGIFKNCLVDNNAGAGLLTVGDVASISYIGGKIVGATNWSIYGTGPNAVFQNTTIVGSPVNLRTGAGTYDSANTHFNNCLITLDSTLSPTKLVYGNYVMDFGGGAGGFFTNCIIDSKDRGTIYGGGGCVFTDCTFKQAPTRKGYNGYPFMSGNFYGTNKWYRPGDGVMLPNLNLSKFYGPFYVNDKEVAEFKK